MSSQKNTTALDSLRRRLLQLIEYAAAILLAGIMFLTIVDVVARYLFRRPIAASFEVTEMAMQVMIYLCIAVAVASNDHIKVTLIDPLLARMPSLEHAVDRLSGVATAIILGFLGFAVIELAQGKRGDVTAVLGLPVAPVAWMIGVILCLSAALAAWAVIRGLSPRGNGND